MKLYIVEDSKQVVNRLVKMLSVFDSIEIIGHSENAEHAKSSIKTLKPDTVILDISLKDGNGYDVLIDVKKNNPPPIVIIFTNYCFPPFKQKCMNAGADYFFDKSSEFEDVIQTLNLINNN